MWALMCGLVSGGMTPFQAPWLFLAGILLTGPLVCGASQIINDWHDREVDALNEPDRPIPSGRVSEAAAPDLLSCGASLHRPGVSCSARGLQAQQRWIASSLGLQRALFA